MGFISHYLKSIFRCYYERHYNKQSMFLLSQGKSTSSHTTQQGQVNERGAVRKYLTQAEQELSIEKRILKIIESDPALQEHLW